MWRPEAALCLRVMPAECRGGRLVAALEAAVSLPSHRLLLGPSARPLRKMVGQGVKVRMDAASNVGVDMMSILALVVEMCATRTVRQWLVSAVG